MISNFIRILCATHLQKVATLLRIACAISLAEDASTHLGVSYLDLRVHIYCHQCLFNIHVLAIPMFERHTGEVIFNSLVKLLNVLRPGWQQACISNSSDGAAVMTCKSHNRIFKLHGTCQQLPPGNVRGVSTRIRDVAGSGFFQIWCPAHQVDLVMQRVFNEMMDGDFVKMMTEFVAYLRRQPSLILTIGAICPFLQRTRWLSMDTTAKYLVRNRVCLRGYLSDPDRASVAAKHSPNDVWWVLVCALRPLTERVAITVVSLQGKTLLVFQQAALLEQLVVDLKEFLAVDGPLNHDEQVAADADLLVIRFSRWSVAFTSIRTCLLDQGSFVVHLMDSFAQTDIVLIFTTIAHLFLSVIDGIVEVVAERDIDNTADDPVPPIFPRDLIAFQQC